MTTVIVPVDFSATSLHAANYAARMMVGHYGVTLLLYHSYSKASDEAKSAAELEALQASLMNENIVKIEILNHHEADFVAGLERAVRHRKADLVIMGITGRSALGQVFFGSNTLKMVATKACPVMIIPEGASFKPVNNVMLTSDFKNTINTTPSAPIKDFLSRFSPKLHIINVDKDHYISLTSDYEKEKQDLRQMFREFDPEFYFMRLYDVDEALNMFAEDKDIDLIIAVQRNHSIMEKIFQRSRTKALSYHTKVPILVMHE
jgi:nucleotide-binding universal stress UspA family protein